MYEQPPSSMVFLYEEAREFLLRINAACVWIAACSVGLEIHKSWCLCSNLCLFQELASVCAHDRDAHLDIRGVKGSEGNWLSAQSAEYPAQLASRAAAILVHHVTQSGQSRIPVQAFRSLYIPRPPSFIHVKDGGGDISAALWPKPNSTDVFSKLRQTFLQLVMNQQLRVPFTQAAASPSDHSPFSQEQIEQAVRLLEVWLAEHSLPCSSECASVPLVWLTPFPLPVFGRRMIGRKELVIPFSSMMRTGHRLTLTRKLFRQSCRRSLITHLSANGVVRWRRPGCTGQLGLQSIDWAW